MVCSTRCLVDFSFKEIGYLLTPIISLFIALFANWISVRNVNKLIDNTNKSQKNEIRREKLEKLFQLSLLLYAKLNCIYIQKQTELDNPESTLSPAEKLQYLKNFPKADICLNQPLPKIIEESAEVRNQMYLIIALYFQSLEEDINKLIFETNNFYDKIHHKELGELKKCLEKLQLPFNEIQSKMTSIINKLI